VQVEVDTAGQAPPPLHFAAAVSVATAQLASRQSMVVSGMVQSG
jgi:hypothetical protein